MARASAAERQEMDKKEAQVRAALEKAEGGTALYRYLPSLLITGPQEAALKNLVVARQRYEQWADASHGRRRWANDGQEPDGHPYPVSFWLQIGDDIRSEVGVHVQAAEQGGYAAAVEGTVVETARQVKEKAGQVVDVAGWPTKYKVALGTVAFAVVVGAGAWLVSEVNTLTGKDA